MVVKIRVKGEKTVFWYSSVLSYSLKGEGSTLSLSLPDGTVRNFPMENIVYYETKH